MTAFGVSLLMASLATPFVLWAARRAALIDEPNHRSSHTAPTPRGGGVAVAFGTIAGASIAGHLTTAIAGVMIGATVLAATGLLDDRIGLPPLPRLLVQFLTPVIVTLAVVNRSGWELLAAAAIAGAVVPAYVNAFNFMDGINGISGSQAAIAGAFLAAVAHTRDASDIRVVGLAVCGASLGFLPFNAVRAKIFLGDVGSYFLGFWLAGVALLLIETGSAATVVAAPFLLYLADTGVVLVRRARRGERLTEAHREHAYQRLAQSGWSHFSVAALCAAVSGLCTFVMYSLRDASGLDQALGLAGCLATVAGYLALPEWRGRRVVRTAA